MIIHTHTHKIETMCAQNINVVFYFRVLLQNFQQQKKSYIKTLYAVLVGCFPASSYFIFLDFKKIENIKY
jgi:hypothetical protein